MYIAVIRIGLLKDAINPGSKHIGVSFAPEGVTASKSG